MQRARWWDPRTWFAFAFWELRTIFAAIRDDGWSDWKATVVIIVVEILGIVALTGAASVYLGRRLIDQSSSYVYILPLALVLLNLKAVLGKNKRWNRLSREFESYPAPIRLGGGWAVVLLTFLMIFVASHFAVAQRHLPH